MCCQGQVLSQDVQADGKGSRKMKKTSKREATRGHLVAELSHAPFWVQAMTVTHRTVLGVIAVTQVVQKSVNDLSHILCTEAGRRVIQFGTSSSQKVSQRGKYSYLEKSPKWICPLCNYLLSTFHARALC